MKDYVDARREFWEGLVCACLSNPDKDLDSGPSVERCMQMWDARYKLGPNGTCVSRDTEDGTYKASDAGAA